MSGNDPATGIAEGLAKPFEGCSLTVYPDPGTGAEPWTQGWGSTRDGNGNPLTANSPPIDQATADAWFARDLQAAMAAVRSLVNVPLGNNQAGALGSFVYNVGKGNFGTSTLLADLNAGNYDQVGPQLLRWNHAGGVVLPGLTRRRQAEANMFNTPDQIA